MRTFLLTMLMAIPAFATGERVAVASNNPLREGICISMTCVAPSAPHEATVQMRKSGNSMEFTVTNSMGAVKLTQTMRLDDDGEVSSIDAAHVVTLMVKAIEGPQPAPKKEVKQAVAKRTSLKGGKLIARR